MSSSCNRGDLARDCRTPQGLKYLLLGPLYKKLAQLFKISNFILFTVLSPKLSYGLFTGVFTSSFPKCTLLCSSHPTNRPRSPFPHHPQAQRFPSACPNNYMHSFCCYWKCSHCLHSQIIWFYLTRLPNTNSRLWCGQFLHSVSNM